MSGWGILAAGLGGGANAVGNITAGMIDQERRLQSAQVLSDIEEQKQLRIAERLDQMGRDRDIDAATGEVGKARLKAAQDSARGMIPVEVEKANALRPGKLADAQALADVATEADIKRATAILPLEVKRAYAVADAAGAASAKYREKAKTFADKAAEIEAVIKRPLTEDELLGVLGLAKSQPTDKVTTTDTVEDPSSGRKSERKVESTVPRGKRSQDESADPIQIKAAMDAARAAKGGPAPAASAATPGILPAASADVDPITMANDRTLRQIAAIQGHKDQARARAELERRATNTPEIDTTGIGFGG